MTMTHSDPSREADPHSVPDVEVFHYSKMEYLWAGPTTVWGVRLAEAMQDGLDRMTAAAELSGWYWWFCFPGCMPDSDPFGPFATEALALADARDTGEVVTP